MKLEALQRNTAMTEFERSCGNIKKLIDDWGDSERKYALLKLLDYYEEGLLNDLFKPKDEEDREILATMQRHITACEEMRRSIRKEFIERR